MELSRKKEINFTSGPILPPLIKFLMPVLLAIAIQSLYSAVDLLIVGQFGEAFNVSGVSIGGSLTYSIQGVITGLAMGTTILLGQFIGEGRKKEAGDVIGTAIIMFAATAIVVTLALFFCAGPCIDLMQIPKEAYSEGLVYVKICSIGMIFIVAYNVLGSVFRGIGDSTTPLIAVSVACVINLIGDLILVGLCHMAAAGAAIATVVAQGVSVAVSLYIAKRRGLPFEFSRKNLKINPSYAKKVVKFGVPLAIQSFVISGSFLIQQAILNSLGVIESAGVGVAGRLVNFIMLFPEAALQALSAFVAHNIGARKVERAKKAMLHTMWMCIAFSCVMAAITLFNGTLVTGIFTTDEAVKVAGADYLKAFVIDNFLCSFLFALTGYFNGAGMTGISLSQAIVGVVFRIPLSFLFKSLTSTLFVIGLATPAATAMQLLFCVICYLITNKKISEKYGQKVNI